MGQPPAERIEVWRRIDRCLDELLELPPGDRRARLEELDRQDGELRSRVEELLRACDPSDGFLEEPLGRIASDRLGPVAPGPAGEAGATTPEPRVGSNLGPYRLVRPIGQGGMATVYLGERTDGILEHPVALKVPKPAAVVAGGERRFRAEGEILAGLDHPNVVRMLDRGSAAEGLPYLVMEHVDGEAIDRYCERLKLSEDERIRLFLIVCSAVAHLHRNRVIHLDLKPSNILVTAQGEPRLLDFGIAEVLEPDAGKTVSGSGLRPATPASAAPEQLDGRPCSAATDVFALGLLLHRLLTGPDALQRSGAECAGTARGGALSRVGRAVELPRRLGRIVRRAVHPDPGARHPSAQCLASALRRRLDARAAPRRRAVRSSPRASAASRTGRRVAGPAHGGFPPAVAYSKVKRRIRRIRQIERRRRPKR